ncbi:MAG: carbohydrate binding family 9 domain-containing protein [Candidatus Aminicenantales bacterium]
MKKRLRMLLPALFLTAGVALGADLKAVRATVEPRIDGDLSDPVWQSALPFGDFRMVEPRPGAEPTERTEIRILYDDGNLYIGLRCDDGESDLIAASSMGHDSGGAKSPRGYAHAPQSPGDDIVRVLLDPFQDKRSAYVFFVNPRGARSEGLVYAGNATLDWDGIWEARSRVSEAGWSAELKIPFKTISFKPGLTVWGINVERVIARKQETIRLSGTGRDSNFNNPMEAAALEGIEGIRQGKGLTFRPYGLISAQDDGPGEAGSVWKPDFGFDLYKNFTPNLVGAASYNMDFAETEVDERRINLTRFSLYFPEKRMFFLEGSEVFSFSSSVSFMPFFSRKIGLYEGEQIPVLFGTKLYGKIGDTSLAVLDVQTGKSEGLAGRNLLAARITRNLFAQSKIGWIFTNGSPSGERNSLAGMDFNYSSSRFLGNKNIMLAAWTVYNWNEQKAGRHHGFGFRADYPNDRWNVQTTYAYYGEALDPGLGFMMRQGIQTAYARVAFQPRPSAGLAARFVRQFFFSASADYYWDLAGRLETSTISITPLSLNTHSGDRFGFEAVQTRDVLPYAFEVSRGVVLPARAFDFRNYQISFNSATHRPATFELKYKFGEFYSGRLDDLQVGLGLRFGGSVNLSLNTDLVRGRLPEGHFSENVYQIKADFFWTPDLSLMNYVQYDDVSRQLGWSSRIRWQISPGNEIFLVFNKNWEKRWDPANRFFPLEQRGVLKISFSIRP